MDEQLASWHPTKSEVDEIVRELRPLIARLSASATEVLRVGHRQPITH